MRASILIVDDEKEMLDLLTWILRGEFEIITASDGEEALERLKERDFDLCLLDIMMPGRDGLDVLKTMQKEKIDVPVIFLTARAETEDRVEGLEQGADDYIVKPFEPREVIARIRSVLRRTSRREAGERITVDGLVLDLTGRTARVRGRELKLTRIEFDLLSLLIRHPGRAFSREELLEKVWGVDFLGDERTVDTHVKNLREKFRTAGYPPESIETVWGFGYKWRTS